MLPLSLGFLWHSIRESHLLRKDYKLCGIVIAPNIVGAQLRFFEKHKLHTEC
ncbi:hypothetical protein NHE_0399 [Neorickettsia helminthoeca str. Oregon]|uniref:Uncharacterized protein n=2 Tax=Neorickettsia helminthoeca TaxID=33994 RepID=X5GWA1_9RICK|nr:hypothetical protein NHE_0399 [Neorickettsia helminthoeca str. Oregon]